MSIIGDLALKNLGLDIENEEQKQTRWRYK